MERTIPGARNIKPTVGFIGLGDQGAPIAQAIGDARFPLYVWARRPASLEVLDGYPQTVASSVAELAAKSDVVGLCLREDSDAVGPAGSGQFGKLFNNTLMMMNHRSALDVLRLAVDLKLPIGPPLAVLRSGSAGSFALDAVGPLVTAENVAHLQPLELLDMELFAGAVAALGDAARPVIDRAVAGARDLDQQGRDAGPPAPQRNSGQSGLEGQVPGRHAVAAEPDASSSPGASQAANPPTSTTTATRKARTIHSVRRPRD